MPMAATKPTTANTAATKIDSMTCYPFLRRARLRAASWAAQFSQEKKKRCGAHHKELESSRCICSLSGAFLPATLDNNPSCGLNSHHLVPPEGAFEAFDSGDDRRGGAGDAASNLRDRTGTNTRHGWGGGRRGRR